MAKGIEIGVASETKAFKQGIDAGVIAPLEDAEQALKDLGDAKGLDSLENDLEAAQDASKKLARETKRTADDIEDEYRKAYGKLKRESKESYDDAGKATEAFKDEAKQNFAETAASFDGSMDSIVDMAQSTFGGLATAIGGPLGIALAAAGALAGSALTGIIEMSANMKDKVTENFEQMVANGSRSLSLLQENEQIAKVWSEQSDKIKRISELTGAPVERVARALALGGDSAQALADALDKTQASGRRPEVRNLVNDLHNVIRAQEDAADRYDDYVRTVNIGAAQQGDRLTELAKTYGKLPTELKTSVSLDTTELDRELRKPRRVQVDLVTRSGTRVPW